MILKQRCTSNRVALLLYNTKKASCERLKKCGTNHVHPQFCLCHVHRTAKYEPLLLYSSSIQLFLMTTILHRKKI